VAGGTPEEDPGYGRTTEVLKRTGGDKQKLVGEETEEKKRGGGKRAHTGRYVEKRSPPRKQRGNGNDVRVEDTV